LSATATSPGIDPRIRARRIEVQRHNGRRRLRRLIDVLLVLAVLGGFVGALRSPLLDVASVEVGGANHTGSDAVLARAGVAPGDQLMDLHLGAIGARVAELPWVRRVRVSRGLDGVVRLEVVERTPVAVVGAGDGAVVVDDLGRVLAPRAGLAGVDELVQVVGIEEIPAPGAVLAPTAQAALAVAGRLQAAVPGAVTSLRAGEELEGTLAVGGTVLLGDANRIAAKLRSLATVLAQVDLSCLATVDVRAPGSPVLTREPGCP
jgi:cell division protein FtsQ